MAGLLTKETKLGYSDTKGGSYTNLDLLMEVPEMGGSKTKIDVTTLNDSVKQSIFGLSDPGDLQMKFLYENAEGSAWRILKGFEESGSKKYYCVEYPDGTTAEFQALVTIKMDSAPVDAALTCTASFALQSDIDWNNPTEIG